MVVVQTPGTYNIATAGANPYEGAHLHCLDLDADDLTLYIGPGVVLQLASGSQTDAGGEVDIVVFQDRTNIAIVGGGKITGNTAGQSGWTGGYSQQTNGRIIKGYNSAGGSSNVLIEGLELEDHWSNSIDIAGNENVLVRGVRSKDTGEGPLITSCINARFDDCVHEDASGVIVGDWFEWSVCVGGGSRGCKAKGTGIEQGGAAFDLFGSTDLRVMDFEIDGTHGGISQGTTGANICDRNVVGPGVIKNLPQPAAGNTTALESAEGSTTYANIVIDTCDIACQFTNGASLGVQSVIGVKVYSCRWGFYVTDHTIATFDNCVVDGCSVKSGVYLYRDQANSTMQVDVRNCTLINNARYGVEVDGAGNADFTPSGSVIGCNLTGNTSGPIRWTNSSPPTTTGDVGMEVHNCVMPIPAAIDPVAGMPVLRHNGNAGTWTTLGVGSLNQILFIEWNGSRTLKDVANGGNCQLAGSADFVASDKDTMVLRWVAPDAEWHEVSRSVN